MTAATIQQELEALANPQDAVNLLRFFKTGPGEYGEGDCFRGIRMPVLRQLIRPNQDLPLDEAERLLHSAFHEDRLLALLILVRRFKRGGEALQKEIYDLYLANTDLINNWDLVDASAPPIPGAYLYTRDKEPLFLLTESPRLWERRIAIMATFHYIRRGAFAETFALASLLLHDTEDLIHKAVGWMLREVGKRDRQAEEDFLRSVYRQMPRTMLRYAIEKFPEPLRQAYLRGTV